AGIDEATAAVSELQDTPRGTVRLTAPTDLGDRLLAPILVGFAARYPEVRVDVVLTQRFVDLVHEGIDLALRVGRLGDSRLVARAGRDGASELRRVLPRHAAEGPPLHLVYPSARLVPKRVALLRDQILQEMPQRLKP